MNASSKIIKTLVLNLKQWLKISLQSYRHQFKIPVYHLLKVDKLLLLVIWKYKGPIATMGIQKKNTTE
jgi:hypothetical protein